MRFRLAPLERRNGRWHLRIWPLAFWTTLFNLIVVAAVYWWTEGPGANLRPVPARAMKHAVAVIGQDAPLLDAPDDAAKRLETLHRGDTVDLYVAQPAGWCFVTRPNARPADYRLSGYNGGVAGYVRRQLLQVPDSMLRNISLQR